MTIDHLKEATEEILKHAPEYNRAKMYYSGEEFDAWISQAITDLLRGEDFEGVLNYAAIPVDSVADRIQLLTIKGPDEKTTRLINELWSGNKMNLRFGQFVLDALTFGDYFIVVWPDEVAFSELMDIDLPAVAELTAPAHQRAKFMFADALTTRAFYDDGGELLYVARMWQQEDEDGEAIDRVNLFYPDRIEKYWKRVKDSKVEKFEEWFDEGQIEWPMDNPYGQIPYFQFSTAFPYGRPEHKALYGVQDAINRIFQTHIASIEFLGFPIIYALMDESSSQGTSEFEFEPVDDGSDPAEAAASLKARPGEVWALRGKSVGQLEPAGSTSFTESIKNYKEIASELSGLPARLFTSTDGQHPGADAVNAADAVLRQRVVDRELMLAASLSQMMAFALKLAYGIEVPPEEITVLWRPQKIEIDDKMIKVFEFKRALGVTDRQILSEMGYTTTEIDAWLGVNVDLVPREIVPLETKLPGSTIQDE